MDSFGRLFRVTIFGESHGPHLGVVIDGCPAGLPLSAEDFSSDLCRRQAGAPGTTPRVESDEPFLASGVFQGRTTGAPLMILFSNANTRSEDYDQLLTHPRPGHADWVSSQKFGGYQDHRGGGHFSGRLTLALVAAGVVAKRVVAPARVCADLVEVHGSSDIETEIAAAAARKDSVGGVVACHVEGLPVGLGEPFFDSVESLISHIIFAIPAVRGIEFGTGFAAARMFGSEHNDLLIGPSGETATNHAGGVVGGISNGNPLVFRVAFKPTSSIGVKQNTLNLATGEVAPLDIGGRHDVCVARRAPVVVEAAAAIVLADLALLSQSAARIQPTKHWQT